MEDPRNLGPATCPQRYPINTRPGALVAGGGGGGARGGGGGGGESSGRPGEGEQGEGARDGQSGGADTHQGRGSWPGAPSPASPTRVGVPVRRSLRTGIWLR